MDAPFSFSDSSQLHHIGVVESCFPDKFGTPRQPGLAPKSRAKIKIFSKWHPQYSLQGLAEFSHLWVFFKFHANQVSAFHPKVHPPRLKGESIGVFATRSPHRPNDLGLSLVTIERVGADFIEISGHDLIDGTPIFDLKPYIPAVESIPDARAGWTESVDSKSLIVTWEAEAKGRLLEWMAKTGRKELQELVENLLILDPRPQLYKGYEGKEDAPYRTVHCMRLYEGDIHFKFVQANEVRVVKLLLDGP